MRMEVPCCGGISYAAEKAVARCGKKLPVQIITIGTDGEIDALIAALKEYIV